MFGKGDGWDLIPLSLFLSLLPSSFSLLPYLPTLPLPSSCLQSLLTFCLSAHAPSPTLPLPVTSPPAFPYLPTSHAYPTTFSCLIYHIHLPSWHLCENSEKRLYAFIIKHSCNKTNLVAWRHVWPSPSACMHVWTRVGHDCMPWSHT